LEFDHKYCQAQRWNCTVCGIVLDRISTAFVVAFDDVVELDVVALSAATKEGIGDSAGNRKVKSNL